MAPNAGFVENPEYELFTSRTKVTLEAQPLADFLWTKGDEPHFSRRLAMLKKYPQVREKDPLLMPHDVALWLSFFVLTMCWLCVDQDALWP